MKTILVVEDNRDNMALIEEILEDEGFQVAKAGSAEDGLTLAQKTRVDLILMDISLPGMNGLEATKALKADQSTKDIPIIALTAHAYDSDREKALTAGCDDFITKPLDEELLLIAIQRLLQ